MSGGKPLDISSAEALPMLAKEVEKLMRQRGGRPDTGRSDVRTGDRWGKASDSSRCWVNLGNLCKTCAKSTIHG